MGNIVKLVFNAVATGSGFSKMYGEVKGLAAAMPGLTKATMILGQTFGSTGAAVGRMATMLLQGGIWGAAAEGARLLIEKFGLFKDKTEETKEKLDKLAESTRKFYETINANSQKSLERIDSETKRRNEQLDITNRMIKAELQLQKARALSAGDTKSAERIDRQMVEADQATSMSKAVATEQEAAAKYRTAEGDLDAARKAVKQAHDEIESIKESIFISNWDKLRSNAESSFKAAFGQNARFDDSGLWKHFRENFSFTTDDEAPVKNIYNGKFYRITSGEKESINAAKERLALAEKNREAQHKAADEARESYKAARDNVKALKAEQEAANAEAERAALKSNYERQLAYAKQMRDLEAKINAEIRSRDSLNDDELEQLRAKYEQKRAEAELAVSDAEGKKLMADRYGTDQDKAVADKELKLARERVKTIAAEEKKAEEDLAQKKKEERIKALKEEILKENEALKDEVSKNNEARKKSLQKDIEANSKRAADLQQKLADATARANAAQDVFGNAAGMDQGGDLRGRRQNDENDRRFNDRFTKLVTSGKIRRNANGEWEADGRLSNLNKAILDRLNADENRKRLEKENDKVVKKLDELKKAIEQMSTL